MSDPALNLPIRSSFDASGTNAAMSALRQLQAAQKAQPSGGGTAATAQAAVAQQRLATEQQRTALTSNQAAVAQQRLSTEEQRTATATAQAAAAQTRAETAALRLAKAQDQVANASQKSARFAKQMGDAFQSSLMGIIGPAALAGTAIAAVGKTSELVQLGAQAIQTRERFDGLAASAHTTGDALTQALRSASGGTISDLNLQLAANRAQLLGVAHSAGEFSTLMEIARARAQDMGISTQFAFDSLVTGLGRGSPLILDNLGITLSVAEANETYAKQIGKTAAALTEAEQKQALINAVLAQGKASLDATGGAAETAQTKIERFSASIENAKTSFGSLLALQAGPFLDEITKITDALSGVGSITGGVEGLAKALAQLSDIGDLGPIGQLRDLGETLGLPDVSQQIGATTASWGALIGALREGASVTDALTAAGKAGMPVLQGQAAAAHQSAQAMSAVAQAQMAHADAALASAQAQRDHSQADLVAAQASLDYAAALQEDAAKGEVASAQAQILTFAKQNLAQQAMIAANAMLASGQSGEAAAARLATSSSLVDQLTAAYLRLASAQAAANQKALNNVNTAFYLKGKNSNEAEVRGFKRSVIDSQMAKERKAYQDNAKAVDEAKRRQVYAVGTANQQIAQREADLAEAERLYGKKSAQYIDAETALQQERAQAAKGRGRAAGAAKLSDQQKFNSQQMAIAERADNQLEDAEAAHYKKLIDIEKNYQEKSLAQQRANEISKRTSELDYLKAITGSELNATKEGQAEVQRINERYYADFDAAQKAAQAGNAEQSEKMVEAARKRADMEIRYAEEIEKAKKDKNTGEVTRLQALREKERQILDEQEKQIREGGDANAKARDEAIAQENQRYDEQTAHIKEQADRAADAKVSAAQRSGKAVEGENDALQHQLDLLHQIKDAAGEIPAPGGTGETGGESGGESAAAGGGTFVTRGPTTLTVGDNPGGAELVQVTPLSGKGQTRVGGGMARMAGGGALVAGGGGAMATAGGGSSDELATLAHVVAFLSGILPLIKHHNQLLKEVRTYQHTMEETIRVFSQIAALHKALAQPLPPLPPGIFEQLAGELNTAVHAVADQVDPNIHRVRRALEHMLAAEKTAVEILMQVVALRQSLAVPTKPLALDLVRALAAESVQVVAIIREQIVVANQKQADELKRYADLVQASVGALKEIADLHKELSDAVPALDIGKVQALAAESVRLVQILQEQVIPLAEQDAELLKRYQETAGAAVATLKDIADLARSLKEATPAISLATITRLADEARVVTQIVLRRLIPLSEDQAAALKRYAETEGASVAVLKDIADLGKAMAEPVAPISPAMMNRLADTAAQATRIILARAVPVTEAQGEALKRYADTQGAAIEVLKNTLELPAKLFTDYQSPSDAQISRVVADANRIARKINDAAKAYDTKGLEAAKAFSDAIGGTFAAFKDGLLFFQALNSGDFQLDPKKMAQFEVAMGRTIAMAGRLGRQAAAIGPANVAALQSTAQALTASYDSMIRLGAVPFGNLPQMMGGGGGNTTIFNNTFVLPPGTSQQMGRQILGQLQQQLTMRK